MKKKLFYSLSCLVVFFGLQANAQKVRTDSVPKLQATAQMILQVKLLDEFVERFNYKKTFRNTVPDSAFRKEFSRQAYLSLLFNADEKRLDSGKAGYSPTYRKLKDEFVNHVVQNKLMIDNLMTGVYAQARCEVTYKARKEEVTILFRKMVYPSTASEWLIHRVYAPWLATPPLDSTVRITIAPNAHETNFMGVNRIFEGKKNLRQVQDTDFVYDNRVVFQYLLQNGEVQFKHVRKLTFYFTSIQGWVFTVKEFSRATLNSGWLISDLQKTGKSLPIDEFLLN